MKLLMFEYRKFSWSHLLQELIVISLCSVVIALIFMLIIAETYSINIFLKYLIISENMGLCIGLPCCILLPLFKPAGAFFHMMLLTGCVVGGAVLGGVISSPFLTSEWGGMGATVPVATILTGIILGFIVSSGFIAKERFLSMNLAMGEEKLARISLEKEKLNADLKLLQAQVEPHFLFNTLSNILSLLDHDVDTGKQMLENLTAYLRTSLLQSRKERNLIGQEVKMIQSYLDIFKIRMGDRLNYTIDFPEEILHFPIPPMMIQPLVENCVKHGLESKIDGGHITLKGALGQNRLIIEVSDTGVGVQEKSGSGVGTGNIKKRLKAMYGDQAVLRFEDMAPSGLKAIMEIPYDPDHSTDRR